MLNPPVFDISFIPSSYFNMLTTLLAFISAICIRAVAKGGMAVFLGDPTPQQEKRLTLNPLAHVDPLGTLILPVLCLMAGASFIIGWGQAVPLQLHRLKPKRLGTFLVFCAGSIGNIVCAICCALLLHLNAGADTLGNELLYKILMTNVALAIFNVLPFPHTDGGKMVFSFCSPAVQEKIDSLRVYSSFLLLGLLLLSELLSMRTGITMDPFEVLVQAPVQDITKDILKMTGHK